jgi:hypothetical protein
MAELLSCGECVDLGFFILIRYNGYTVIAAYRGMSIAFPALAVLRLSNKSRYDALFGSFGRDFTGYLRRTLPALIILS